LPKTPEGFVPEQYSSGIDVQEIPQHEQYIASAPTSVTAFVGRTQRGPVNEPVRLENFADYQRVFGGLWGMSPLSFAVEQYFSQGGQVAFVVRVINGGRGASLSLPAGDEFLRLRARAPGTHDAIRASVDFDGIESSDTGAFNLVVQRLTQPGSERVLEQESYRGVSVSEDHERFVASFLSDSRLVSLEGDVPSVRPDRTPAATPEKHIGYLSTNRDGDDGEPLTDYDIIGSATKYTGMFALSRTDGFNLLCIPPLDRDRDVNLVTWLAAVRYCKSHSAMLIVDPPAEWTTVDLAVAGMRKMNFASEDAVIAFPRLHTLGGISRNRPQAPCGVVAGLLARNDARHGVWVTPSGDKANINSRTRPCIMLDEQDAIRLASVGVNGILSGRPGAPARMASARTMAAGDSSAPSWKYLATRRLSLKILQDVERGTRWSVFGVTDTSVPQMLKSQVEQYLDGLWKQGALVGDEPSEAYFVRCESDSGIFSDFNVEGIRFVLGFSLRRPGEFLSFEINQHRNGARISRSNLQPYAEYGQ
jgi:phage tail sheath protein FI